MPACARLLGPEQLQQLAPRLVLLHDPVADVRPVEAVHELPGAVQLEPGRDLGPGGLRGRRGQRDPRHVRPAFVQHGQLEVVRPEVVSPLGHAVRLVDGEQRDLGPVQQAYRGLGLQPLRGQVQQVQLAGQQRVLGGPALGRVLGRVQEAGPHAQRGQRVHLVLHQRDQRRDDHAGALPDQRRDLIAQRLAATGRHQHERVAAAGHMVDDLFLRTAERLVPEDPLQDVHCCHARDTTGHRCQIGTAAQSYWARAKVLM